MIVRATLRFALALVVGAPLGSSCASGSAGDSRALPTGLHGLSDLLEGCAPAENGDGAQRFSCPEGVDVGARPAQDGEPLYRADANARATALGAQLVWDQTVVPTEADSGLVERARALLPLNDEPSATWLGAVHALGDGTSEEVWCASSSEAGDARCVDVMGAMLARRTGGALPPPRSAQGPTTAFGRSLSLPTTCSVENATKKSGVVRCDDGVRLSWSAYPTMEDALQALQAQHDATGESQAEEPEPFSCVLLGEVAQCERRARAIAGVTYIQGETVAVACYGPGELLEHGACRALIQAK